MLTALLFTLALVAGVALGNGLCARVRAREEQRLLAEWWERNTPRHFNCRCTVFDGGAR